PRVGSRLFGRSCPKGGAGWGATEPIRAGRHLVGAERGGLACPVTPDKSGLKNRLVDWEELSPQGREPSSYLVRSRRRDPRGVALLIVGEPNTRHALL